MTKLRNKRHEIGISMIELALRADVSPSTLALVERGKRPSRRTAVKIADTLATDPRDLWHDFDELRAY